MGMEQKKRPKIIDIMLAVADKKKEYRHRHWRRRLFALGALLALITPFAISLAIIGGGVSVIMYNHSQNPYINIGNEVNHYYAIAEYPTPVDQDDEAQLAKTRASGNQYQVFLYAWNTHIVTRENPQYATAIYDIYIERDGRHAGSYKLAVTLSIMNDGRHWRIISINKPAQT